MTDQDISVNSIVPNIQYIRGHRREVGVLDRVGAGMVHRDRDAPNESSQISQVT